MQLRVKACTQRVARCRTNAVLPMNIRSYRGQRHLPRGMNVADGRELAEGAIWTRSAVSASAPLQPAHCSLHLYTHRLRLESCASAHCQSFCSRPFFALHLIISPSHRSARLSCKLLGLACNSNARFSRHDITPNQRSCPTS